MTTPELSEQLTDLVTSIDGVVQVYDARPTALAAAADLVAAVVGQQAGEPIAVTGSGEGIGVAVSVAISDSSPAAEVCERILEAISGHLGADAGGPPVGLVKIQVSRISSGDEGGGPGA